MKKILLVLCAIPFLLSAQRVTEKTAKENVFMQRMVQKRQTDNRVFVYSGSEKMLPDSIYTYESEGKRLTSEAAITYDEDDRRILEKGIRYERVYDEESGEYFMRSVEYKIDYTYTQQADSLLEEIIYSDLVDEEWVYTDKDLNVMNANGHQIGMFIYDFDAEKQDWVLDYKLNAVTFNEKGNPIVLVDSTMSSQGVLEEIMKAELGYNELDQMVEMITYVDAAETESPSDSEKEWVMLEKIELVYDEDGKRKEDIYYGYDSEAEIWIYDRTATYEYDEQGNIISEKEGNDGNISWEVYYTNIYASRDANDAILAVYSQAYPNPVTDVLFVSVEGADGAVITLVNATGAVLFQQKTTQSITSIPVQSYAKGYYFLLVQTAIGTKTHKVIIR